VFASSAHHSNAPHLSNRSGRPGRRVPLMEWQRALLGWSSSASSTTAAAGASGVSQHATTSHAGSNGTPRAGVDGAARSSFLFSHYPNPVMAAIRFFQMKLAPVLGAAFAQAALQLAMQHEEKELRAHGRYPASTVTGTAPAAPVSSQAAHSGTLDSSSMDGVLKAEPRTDTDSKPAQSGLRSAAAAAAAVGEDAKASGGMADGAGSALPQGDIKPEPMPVTAGDSASVKDNNDDKHAGGAGVNTSAGSVKLPSPAESSAHAQNVPTAMDTDGSGAGAGGDSSSNAMLGVVKSEVAPDTGVSSGTAIKQEPESTSATAATDAVIANEVKPEGRVDPVNGSSATSAAGVTSSAAAAPVKDSKPVTVRERDDSANAQTAAAVAAVQKTGLSSAILSTVQVCTRWGRICMCVCVCVCVWRSV